MNSNISRATFSRLPLYLDYLKKISEKGEKVVSSTKIAKALNLGEVQTRKDLNSVSGKGKPRTGYLTHELIKELEEILGEHNVSNAVVVGAGRLGLAMLSYEGFLKYGLKIVASFDNNIEVIKSQNSNKVLHISEFSGYVKQNKIKTGIIAVPRTAAQQVCELMLENGIKAIWNFAPVSLEVPDDVLLFQENLALSLAYLNYQLKVKDQNSD